MLVRTVFQHFKNRKYYEKLFSGYDVNSANPLIVYRGLYPCFETWARPREEFYGKVNNDTVDRFKYVGNIYGSELPSTTYGCNKTGKMIRSFGTCRHVETNEIYEVCQELQPDFHVTMIPVSQFKANFSKIGDLTKLHHLPV